jgi:hypothetical protein
MGGFSSENLKIMRFYSLRNDFQGEKFLPSLYHTSRGVHLTVILDLYPERFTILVLTAC